MPLELTIPVTDQNFDEKQYLAGNLDVKGAVALGKIPSGRVHFERHGRQEGRRMAGETSALAQLRRDKMERLKPLLDTELPCRWANGKADFLTSELREEMRIVDTDAVSSHGYDETGVEMINQYRDGLILDCGAGSRSVYFENVVNYEIVDYLSTDVIGVGEKLPFKDNSFDGVLSIAVLEHVRDPFRCAREISRVLKPGGRLYCAIPFLQPYHGYPHHYFNATPQGHRRLFEDELIVDDVKVIGSTHPIWALSWILKSWVDGLPADTGNTFRKMTVEDLMRPPLAQTSLPFCEQLSAGAQLDLACATVLTARKALL